MVAMDEGIQKSGVVLIYYGIEQNGFSHDQPTKCLDLCSSLPIRIEAAHACYDNPSLAPLFDIATHNMTSECLVRFRVHCGTDLECQDVLKTFGIPIDKKTFPLKSNGIVDQSHMNQWIQSLNEELTRPSRNVASARVPSVSSAGVSSVASGPGSIITPTAMDIIMGRGRRGLRSQGNRRYKEMLLAYRSKYDAGNNFEKTMVAEFVLKRLKNIGCRFIKESGGEGRWVEVLDETARQKISHAFRNLRGSPDSPNC